VKLKQLEAAYIGAQADGKLAQGRLDNIDKEIVVMIAEMDAKDASIRNEKERLDAELATIVGEFEAKQEEDGLRKDRAALEREKIKREMERLRQGSGQTKADLEDALTEVEIEVEDLDAKIAEIVASDNEDVQTATRKLEKLRAIKVERRDAIQAQFDDLTS